MCRLFIIVLSIIVGCVQLEANTPKASAAILGTFYLEHPEDLPLDAIEKLSGWQEMPPTGISHGNTKSFFYVKLNVTTDENATDDILEVGSNRLRQVDLIERTKAGAVVIRKGGADIPMSQREFKYSEPTFRIQLPAHSAQTYYLKVSSNTVIKIPVHLVAFSDFINAQTDYSLFSGLYSGLLLLMLIYNIILYWAFRENSYLYYSVTNLAVVLYYIVFDGIATMVLFPESPRFVHSLLSILAMLYAGTYLMFVAQFSQLRAKHPLLDKLLWYFGYTLLFIGIFGHFTIGARMMNNLTIMISFSAVLVSFIAVLFVDSRNNAALKWFKSGNIFLLLFVLIFLFFLVGYLPSNVFTRNAYRIGTLIELIFFSLALAIRIRTIDDNRRTAEVRAEARMQFAADVSHELRTPLTAIVALTDLMGESQLDTKQTEYLRALKSAAGTMREFANDVLIYAKLEREKVSPERIAFSLHETLQKVADIYEQMARARGITFQRAWEIAPKKLWMGDPLRIGQVLQNLLSNALKFTSTGDKIVLGATVRTIGNKERIEISVRDTGKGISPEKLTDIFGAYVQADASTERHYGGTGLGLSIARQLSELMGGRLDVESTLGFGTVFTMILYLSPTAQQEKVVTVNYKQQVHQMQKPLRILHVEDQADIRLIFQYFFADTIHHLDSAESGEEGLELFKKHQHDIVFSDVRLPGIDGISVLREIQRIAMERFLPTKTVICSGSLLGNSESLPTPYILIKPISMHDVYATIIHLVNE